MNLKTFLQYAIWTGLYTVLVVPFIVADGSLFPNMFFPFITGKAFTFRIVVEIIFGLWLILIIKDEEFRPKFSWISVSLAIFTLVLFLADLQAVAPAKAFWSNFERMEGWVTIAHLLAYFLVLSSMFTNKQRWLWFLRANVGAGLLMAITSLDNSTEVRFSGPLGNPIYISIYFLFIFFFAIILLHKDVLVRHMTHWSAFKKVFTSLLFYVYTFIAAVSFYITYRTSRGVLLGAIGGLFIMAILIAIFEKEKRVIKQISIGIVVAVILVVVAFLSARQTDFVKNNPTLSRLAEVSWSNVNGQARQYVWPMAIKGFQEKPILGWGQDGFNYVFNKYYDPRMYAQEQWFDRAHNAPLDALVAGGILGLLSYLFIFGAALYSLWFKNNDLDIPTRAIFTGIFAGYFFQALFVFDTLMSYVMFVTAIAYIHSRLVEKQIRKSSFNYFSGFISSREYQNHVLIPFIIILTAVSVWWINVPAMSANTSLIKAYQMVQTGQVRDSIDIFKQALSYHSLGDSEIREQLLSFGPAVVQAKQVDDQTKIDFINLAFGEVNKQIDKVPADARYYILAGSFLNSIGNFDKALPYIKKAIELSPAKQTMRFELVRALANLDRQEEAVAEARAAYELDPNYIQSKTIYEAMLNLKKGK